MLTIRSFVLDTVALLGVGTGIVASVGGYLVNLPSPPERIAIASAWTDPETTGSITPRAYPAPAVETDAEADNPQPQQAVGTAPKGTWTDPPRHQKSR